MTALILKSPFVLPLLNEHRHTHSKKKKQSNEI